MSSKKELEVLKELFKNQVHESFDFQRKSCEDLAAKNRKRSEDLAAKKLEIENKHFASMMKLFHLREQNLSSKDGNDFKALEELAKEKKQFEDQHFEAKRKIRQELAARIQEIEKQHAAMMKTIEDGMAKYY